MDLTCGDAHFFIYCLSDISLGINCDIMTDSNQSHVTNRPFEAYHGDGPYIFISYKHADWKIVYPVIKKLHDAGFNIWYDADLKKGKYYDIQIANHIKNSALFVTFITQEAIRCSSDEEDYLIRELVVANNFKVNRLPIFLEDVELDGFYLMHYLGKQSILKHEYGSEEDKFIKECIRTFRDDFDIVPGKVQSVSETPDIPEIRVPNAKLINTEGIIHDFFDGLTLYDDWRNGNSYKDYLLACTDNFMRNPNSYNAYEFYKMFFRVYQITFEDKSDANFIQNYDYDYPNRVLDTVRLAKRYFKNHDVLPHCLNVFLLGLAIYCDNEKYREHFKRHVLITDYSKYYRTYNGEISDEEFFYRWGIVSLLHGLTYGFPGLDISQRKSFLSELKDILDTDTPIENLFDLNLITAINPNDSRFTDAVRPMSILSKRISEDFSLDLNRTYTLFNGILSFLKENDIFDSGVFSAMLVLLLYGKSLQDNSKDSVFFIYPVIDSASAIFLHHVYRNRLQSDFDLGGMDCNSSPLGYLLILCSEILTFDSADIEYGGDLKFTFNVGSDSMTPDLWRHMDDYLSRVLNIADISEGGTEITARPYSKIREFKVMDYPSEELECSEVPIKICERMAEEFHKGLNLSVSFHDGPADSKLTGVIESEKWISGMYSIGYEVLSEDDNNVAVENFTESQALNLAKWKHEKFCEYKTANGWCYDKVKDNEKRTTPFLVSWDDLKKEAQMFDIDLFASGKIFAYLNSVGYIVIDSKTKVSSDMVPELMDYSDLFYKSVW